MHVGVCELPQELKREGELTLFGMGRPSLDGTKKSSRARAAKMSEQ